MNRPLRWLLAGSVAWGCLLLVPRAEGSEPAREFLDGLRQRGYFEEALDYLEQVRTDESIDAGFREVIDYEAGLTLIDLCIPGGREPEARNSWTRPTSGWPSSWPSIPGTSWPRRPRRNWPASWWSADA